MAFRRESAGRTYSLTLRAREGDLNPRLARARRAGALINPGLRNVLVVDKILAASQLLRRIGLCCLGLGETGLLLIDRGLVGSLFGLDLLTFGQIALLQEPRSRYPPCRSPRHGL